MRGLPRRTRRGRPLPQLPRSAARRRRDPERALRRQPRAHATRARITGVTVRDVGTGDGTDRSSRFAGRTAWSRSFPTPLREFLRTETGGACVLLIATIAALIW